MSGSTPAPDADSTLDAGFDASIDAVARLTGLGKDTLRAWERRYGFPAPQRDALGERRYPPEQVARLVEIARQVRQGRRPGQLLGAGAAATATAGAAAPPRAAARPPPTAGDPPPPRPARSPAPDPAARPVLDPTLAALVERLVAGTGADDVEQALHRQLAEAGPADFAGRVAPALVDAVGRAWAEGRLGVADEHVFSACLMAVLRQAAAQVGAPPAAAGAPRPRVLLATLHGETHGLGLAMAEVMLRAAGVLTLNLGVEVPPDEIARIARRDAVAAVALSFSAVWRPAALRTALDSLRRLLPEGVALWAGGQGAHAGICRECQARRIGALADVAAASRALAPPPRTDLSRP